MIRQKKIRKIMMMISLILNEDASLRKSNFTQSKHHVSRTSRSGVADCSIPTLYDFQIEESDIECI
jgi:hypothetical protein